MITFERFGDFHIFRPSQGTESFVSRRARQHLLLRFSSGVYRGRNEVNPIIQHQFQFYEKLLQTVIPKLITRGAAEFLLYQYDQAWAVLHGEGILDLRERERWMHIEPLFKRAIKYLVEKICLSASNRPIKVNHEEFVFAMECALISVECMVQFAQESDLAHSVFPDDCVLRLFDAGSLISKLLPKGLTSVTLADLRTELFATEIHAISL